MAGKFGQHKRNFTLQGFQKGSDLNVECDFKI